MNVIISQARDWSTRTIEQCIIYFNLHFIYLNTFNINYFKTFTDVLLVYMTFPFTKVIFKHHVFSFTQVWVLIAGCSVISLSS